jgi:hypothetical protein
VAANGEWRMANGGYQLRLALQLFLKSPNQRPKPFSERFGLIHRSSHLVFSKNANAMGDHEMTFHLFQRTLRYPKELDE